MRPAVATPITRDEQCGCCHRQDNVLSLSPVVATHQGAEDPTEDGHPRLEDTTDKLRPTTTTDSTPAIGTGSPWSRGILIRSFGMRAET
jgi:hypothetical protein